MNKFEPVDMVEKSNAIESKTYIENISKQMQLVSLPADIAHLIEQGIKKLDIKKIDSVNKLQQVSEKATLLMPYKIDLLRAEKTRDRELSQETMQSLRRVISEILEILGMEDIYPDDKKNEPIVH